MIKIRKTKLKDYKEIYTLLKSEDMLINNLTKNKFSNMLRRNKNYYFVALEDDKIIGNIFSNHDGGNYVYIYKLVVKKGYRKTGVGNQLIKKVLTVHNKKDLWVYCHIHKENKASINLFKKLGFKIRETHRLFDSIIK